MKLKLSVYGVLCETSEFEINGVNADSSDFGRKSDHDSAEDYGCGDMQFYRVPSTAEILSKYKITEDEYQEIADKLEKLLSFGPSGWCV
jgi:hypothetical protein